MDLSSLPKIRALISAAEKNQPLDEPELLSLAGDLLNTDVPAEVIHEFLELGHFPAANRPFSRSENLDTWLAAEVSLLRKSNYHVGTCLRQRCRRYRDKPLFQLVNGDKITTISYGRALTQIEKITSALSHLIRDEAKPVIALFTPNCPEGAMLDLACLSHNIRVVPIPASVPPDHLNFILEHAAVTHLFCGKLSAPELGDQLKFSSGLKGIVRLPSLTKLPVHSIDWETFLALSADSTADIPPVFDMDGTVSIMYTSGTTSFPKGIRFSQTNIMSKRFARALALPDIGSDAVFLAYLPLFHTFGRFLELINTIFLGATYTFAESPEFTSLLKDFRVVRPTVFISIPKRWKQIHEQVAASVNPDTATADEIRQRVGQITGERLAWGLSAAGYLEPAVFRFFHANGIQLLSGYGMTEATGGILMTPPGDYRYDSVGKPLPGIEAKLAEDGELLLKGPYLSPGYYPKSPPGTFTDGWFHTGDIFRVRKDQYYIVDRKKEIYKNSRGQTISPQKIENMVLDFESVKSVFLVGDALEYNTVLIYPDFRQLPKDLKPENTSAVHQYFRTVIQSVNSFLAPYERILNYAIIDRDFSFERDEITAKETFKRKQVVKNFTACIEPMYRKEYLSLVHDLNEIRLPNWLLREKGVMPADLTWDGNAITLAGTDSRLPLAYDDRQVRIGDFFYTYDHSVIDLDRLIRSPELWVGNESLAVFAGSPAFRHRQDVPYQNLSVNESRLFPSEPASIGTSPPSGFGSLKETITLENLHTLAVRLIRAGISESVQVMEILAEAAGNANNPYRDLTRRILIRMKHHPALAIRLKSIEALLPVLTGEEFSALLQNACDHAESSGETEMIAIDPDLLNGNHCTALHTELRILRQRGLALEPSERVTLNVYLRLISEYSARHPSRFQATRTELNWWNTFCEDPSLRDFTRILLESLTADFRAWLGPTLQVAINPDQGTEYSWSDVITFDQNISRDHKVTLVKALRHFPILKEAIFLFTQNQVIYLTEILPNGIWISLIGDRPEKSVFRVLVQTRGGQAYNFVINLNKSLDKDYLLEETRWLMVMAAHENGRQLVENFGGYWAKPGLYTEEYIHGETLDRYLERHKQEIASGTARDRWQMRWLHFIWNGSMAYIDFWARTGFAHVIREPSPENLIIPEFDYTSGTRLISITGRSPNTDIAPVLFSLYQIFVLDTEEKYPGLVRMADWEVLFTALLQVVTVKKGLRFLTQLAIDLHAGKGPQPQEEFQLTARRIESFIDDVNTYGVLTKQVTFAALRYHRWLELNPDATKEARGGILTELYKDYHLKDLIENYPETRIRYFLMTCFKSAQPALAECLLKLQIGVRAKTISQLDLDSHIQNILEVMELTEAEKYFLIRLAYEHVQSGDASELIAVETGDTGRLELISSVLNARNEQFRIRPPFQPREIARFNQVLEEANMDAEFSPDHRFLLLLNVKDQVIGGIYWKDIGNQTAYLERIVIRRAYRQQKLSIALLHEFFQRLIHLGFTYATVGFFQAGLFYKYGFVIDRQFGGLVKYLKKTES